MENTAEFDYSDYYVFNYSLYDRYIGEPTADVRHIARLIILSIVIVLSLIGNIVVVVISVFCVRLRSLTSVFILNLALADLLFTAVLVFRVCGIVWGLTPMDAMCKVVTLILSTGYYSSIVFLVLMTIQHYMAVVRPQSGWKKGRWVTHVLICAWIISILASLLAVMQVVPHPYPALCLYHNITAVNAILFKENIIFVCAFFFMAFCFIRILLTICKSPPNLRHRSTGLTFILVATFFVFWAPLNIVNFLKILTYYEIISYKVLTHLYDASYICYFFALTRCCLNPMIYGFFGVKYRTVCKRFFKGELLETSHNEGLGSLKANHVF